MHNLCIEYAARYSGHAAERYQEGLVLLGSETPRIGVVGVPLDFIAGVLGLREEGQSK